MRMNVAEAVIEYIRQSDVDTIFGYPGGAVLPLYEALRNSKVKHVLVRNEQSAAHMASGYGRGKNGIGVCLATSGPGATNLITGIATAYMDSIPLVVITGQVDSKNIGSDMFQEADIVGSTEPFTKHNFLVKKAKDIPKFLAEAFYIANTGRKGPVLIDIPIDIQNEIIDFEIIKDVDIRGYKPTFEGNVRQIKRAVQKINNSKKPIICVGGGISSSDGRDFLAEFVEKTKIPVVCTLMGVDSYDNNSEYFAGLLGSHGYPFVNKALNSSDLLIVIGARLADRSTSKYAFKSNQSIIHIDIDPAEIGKNVKTHVPIVGDASNVLKTLNTFDFTLDCSQWQKEIKSSRTKYKKSILDYKEKSNKVNPCVLIDKLSSKMGKNSIMTADVGQNQIWAAHFYNGSKTRKYFTSGGLGTMGYSLPGSIGAKIACPDCDVVAVTGEGGIQMLLGELAVVREQNLDIKIILLTNSRLGMVRELQLNNYGNDSYFGVDIQFNPNFMKLAEAYKIKGIKIETDDEIDEKLEECFSQKGPCLVECIVDPDFPTLSHWRWN